MLNIDSKFELTKDIWLSPNLCRLFDEEQLRAIGCEVYAGYEADEQSRDAWMRRNEAGMDLALQIQKAKTFPWPNCANIAFPLVTIAAMQFHARAYPTLVSGSQVVRCKVSGLDPDGSLARQASGIAMHMNHQLLEEDVCWEEQEDKAILNLSIVGTNFKKTYHSSNRGHNVSELVLAKDLVLNYWAKSVENCSRKTHLIPRSKNEIYENVMSGVWEDCLTASWFANPPRPKRNKKDEEQDNRQGVTPPQPDDTTSLLFLEQHVDLDLDGDGYAEPYIITVESSSKQVVRIVARFESGDAVIRATGGKYKGRIIKIQATEYFTKKTFIPSPDGGIYDIGFGVFLGPLNEAVSSLVNMLLDAGTMQTTAGGFLGRGAKIRSGTNTLGPFEWKRVDCTGDDLRKSMVPATVNAPSDVLFQLLDLLIQYTSRISGTTDTTVGENPGQNTPAQTMQTMVEQGQKVYTAIFKRIWRASKLEFQKLFELNKIYLSLDAVQIGGVTRKDYLMTKGAICPVADPNATSETQRLQKAIALKQAAASTPGYDKDEVERRFLSALGIEDVEKVFKGGGQPAPDPQIAIATIMTQGRSADKKLDAEVKMKALELDIQKLQNAQQEFVAELTEERRVNDAKILQLQGAAMEASANAQSEQSYAQVAMIDAQIAAARHENDRVDAQIGHILHAMEIASSHKIGMSKVNGNGTD